MNPAWAHGNITQTQISMVHTVFNIVTTVLLFPVSDWIIKLAKKIGHVEEEVQDESVVLLDDRIWKPLVSRFSQPFPSLSEWDMWLRILWRLQEKLCSNEKKNRLRS